MGAGLTAHPLEILLYPDFAVCLTFVHLFTLFMVVPIFNTMLRIDRTLIEAARDAGAGGLSILRHVIVPLSLPGIAIGSIFVVALVMGDFVTVQMMSGGQSSSVGVMNAQPDQPAAVSRGRGQRGGAFGRRPPDGRRDVAPRGHSPPRCCTRSAR